jgi:hypothetical protein
VEVNQAALLASNEELGEELHVTQQAYYEVEEENKLIRAEVERLQKCLDTRERQFFDVTGKSFLLGIKSLIRSSYFFRFIGSTVYHYLL